MEKPAVFLSHSTADATPLRLLKNMLDQKTGGSVDLFLSSDGQSIPLGRNWVHELQVALERCQLMFVFITPNSIQSSWLLFESGFGYSKKMKVVPIAFLGCELNKVAPPLSLLQGFNITSCFGLNNLIALINEEFSHKHSESFSDQEYKKITNASGMRDDNSIDIGNNVVQSATFTLINKQKYTLDEIMRELEMLNVEHRQNYETIMLFGGTVSIEGSEQSGYKTQICTSVVLWPHFVYLTSKLNKKIGSSDDIYIRIDFTSDVNVISGFYNITACLLDTNVKLGQEGYLSFHDVLFKVGNDGFIFQQMHNGGPFMEMVASTETLPSFPLGELISLLFKNGVLS